MASSKFHGRYESADRQCDRPGCTEAGEFRAPGYRPNGFDGPGEWRWFCLEHVREFNAGYDWFEGMSADEIFQAQSPMAGWRTESVAFSPRAAVDGMPRWADFDDPLEGFDTNVYIPCLRTGDLVFHFLKKSVRNRLNEAAGEEVGDLTTFRNAVGKLFTKFTQKNAKACAISLPPNFSPVKVDSGAAAAVGISERIRSGRPSGTSRAARCGRQAARYSDSDRIPWRPRRSRPRLVPLVRNSASTGPAAGS